MLHAYIEQELITPTKANVQARKGVALRGDSTSVGWLYNSTLTAQSWD